MAGKQEKKKEIKVYDVEKGWKGRTLVCNCPECNYEIESGSGGGPGGICHCGYEWEIHYSVFAVGTLQKDKEV